MLVSVRSSLSAGVATALLAAGVGVAVVSPVAAAPLPVTASPTVQLSALAISLPKPTKPLTNPFGGATGATPGERIINGYNAVQPWVQYGVELGAWGVGWLPWPIGLIAPQLNIGYSAVEPLSRALVYSVAYAVDGQPELIQPTIKNGIQTSVHNLVQGELSWIASYFPPLPPIGGAAVVAPKVVARAGASVPKSAAAVTAVTDTPVSTPTKRARVKAAASTVVTLPVRVDEASSAAPDAASVAAPPASGLAAPRTHAGTRGSKATPGGATPGAASSVKAGRTGR
jgi:hypothetical protein